MNKDRYKKRGEFKTIWDIIRNNTGLSKSEFLTDKEYCIKNIKNVCAAIQDAIKNNMKITIVGDFDADGITATSIMALTLNSLGVKPNVRLPKKVSEGFGLSESIIDEIDEGLVITVDNGIVAMNAVKKAKEKGLKVIITDHHLPNDDGTLPDADYIINPHIPGTADFENYCGAGIAYKICCELIDDENFKDMLAGYAAIGTIADVMPLIHDNRKIVIKGLKALLNPATRTTGMGALLERCMLTDFISSTNVAFKIGPIINAGERVHEGGAMLSLSGITFNGNYEKALELVDKMIEINEVRKQMVLSGMEDAYLNISNNCLHGDNPLVLSIPTIPEGIVGIIAGQLAEENKVSCFVLTNSEDPDILKGSARGYGDIDIKNMLDQSKDLFVKYGGHEKAAGLSVKKENLEKVRKAFSDYVENLPKVEIDDSVYYDKEIKASEIPYWIKEVEKGEPYGEGNPKPVFKITGFELLPRYSEFFKVKGANKDTITLFGQYADATGFGKASMYKNLNEPKRVDIIGTLGTNHFMGKAKPEVEIIDMISNPKIIEKTSLASLLEKRAISR